MSYKCLPPKVPSKWQKLYVKEQISHKTWDFIANANCNLYARAKVFLSFEVEQSSQKMRTNNLLYSGLPTDFFIGIAIFPLFIMQYGQDYKVI